MAKLKTFTYVFTDANGQTDTIVLTADKVAKNGTGFGSAYAVDAVGGSLGSTVISGEVGRGNAQQSTPHNSYDNAVFLGNAFGDRGSAYGIDANGIEFTTANGRYDLYTVGSQFYLYSAAAGTSVELTLASTNVPCYLAGTQIATEAGEAAVETLTQGDLVRTASGALRPVVWVGTRSYAGRFLARNPRVQPVRFAAGSLGEGMPRRPLLVSPDHAMFLHGVLVPAECLVNGTTITRETGLNRVEYHHVELDTHDVLLAEGAPAESFVDDDSRGLFQNAASHPGAEGAPRAAFYAERVTGGPLLEAIRRELDCRQAA